MTFSAEELFSVKGRTVLVTGASSGIGHAWALQLGAAGANVVVAARRLDRLQSLVEEIQKTGAGKATAVQLDVSSTEEDIDRAVETAWNAYGRIDVLVNNAGVFAGAPLHEASVDDYTLCFNTNVRGLWLVSKAVTKRQVVDKKGGSIINNASIAGVDNAAFPNIGLYSATKGAVIQITVSQARELGQHGIRVNAILPGMFPSEMTEAFVHREEVKQFIKENTAAQRMGVTEHDMHGVLMLLASDASLYITGQKFVVDGGLTIHFKEFA